MLFLQHAYTALYIFAYRHQNLQFKDPEKLQTEEKHQVAK